MKIKLNEPVSGTLLELEVVRVDLPSGTGWSVHMADGKKVVITYYKGFWKPNEISNISQEFWQVIGDEINRLLVEEQQEKHTTITHTMVNTKPKRPRIFFSS
jgi:hypothetical protein